MKETCKPTVHSTLKTIAASGLHFRGFAIACAQLRFALSQSKVILPTDLGITEPVMRSRYKYRRSRG